MDLGSDDLRRVTIIVIFWIIALMGTIGWLITGNNVDLLLKKSQKSAVDLWKFITHPGILIKKVIKPLKSIWSMGRWMVNPAGGTILGVGIVVITLFLYWPGEVFQAIEAWMMFGLVLLPPVILTVIIEWFGKTPKWLIVMTYLPLVIALFIVTGLVTQPDIDLGSPGFRAVALLIFESILYRGGYWISKL